MESSSSRHLSTPMISSSSINVRKSHSSCAFREFIKATALSNLTKDYIKEQVDRQVAEQLSNAMDRLHRVYNHSLDKLENFLLDELVPRLDKSRSDHGRVVKRMMRRLYKLRPMMVNYKDILKKRSGYVENIPDELDERVRRFRKEQHKRTSRARAKSSRIPLRSCFSSLIECRRPKRVTRDGASQFIRVPQPTSQLSVNESREYLPPKVESSQLGPASAKKDIETLYQNLGFSSPPVSELGDAQSRAKKAENRHFGPLPKKSAKLGRTPSAQKMKEIQRRLLETNLLFNKSSYSLFLNRFKFPPPSPLPKPTPSKAAMLTQNPLRWKYQ